MFQPAYRPVEESRPDRQPDRPFDPTGFHLWLPHHGISVDRILTDVDENLETDA